MVADKTVTELRAELFALTQERKEAIAKLNREFDACAKELNRRIQELEPTLACEHCGYKYGHRMGCLTQHPEAPKPKAAPRRRARNLSLVGTEGWSAEDVAHFQELQAKKASA